MHIQGRQKLKFWEKSTFAESAIMKSEFHTGKVFHFMLEIMQFLVLFDQCSSIYRCLVKCFFSCHPKLLLLSTNRHPRFAPTCFSVNVVYIVVFERNFTYFVELSSNGGGVRCSFR